MAANANIDVKNITNCIKESYNLNPSDSLTADIINTKSNTILDENLNAIYNQ